MDTGRLTQGQLIAGAAAVLLIVFLFLPWLQPEGADVQIPEGVPESALPEGIAEPDSFSGWEANNSLDIYLLVLVGFTLIPALMGLAGSREELPLINNAATFLLGVLGTLMMLAVLVDPGEGLERKIGLWLALLAVIGVTVGSYMAMQEEPAERTY